MNMNRIIIMLTLLAYLLTSCTEGGEQASGSLDVYTITAALSGEAEDQVEAQGYIKGIYDSGLNTVNLDVSWAYVDDPLEQICFYIKSEPANPVRTISYSSSAASGNMTVVLAGYKGLRSNEKESLLSGNWSVKLCTTNHPEGLIGGDLQVSLQTEPGKVYVSGFILPDEEELPLRVELGTTKQVRVYVQPYYADDTSYKIISSNPDIFTVTQDGLITANAMGTAKMVVVALDEQGAQSEFDIVVYSEDYVNQIVFEELTDPTILVGESRQIVPQVLPETALNKVLEYTSSDPSVVSVDSEGTITALKSGKVTITASATDGAGASASYEIEAISIEKVNTSGWTAGSDDYANNGPEYAIDGDYDTFWMNKTWAPGKSLWFTFDATPVYRLVVYRDNHGQIRPDGFNLDFCTRTVEIYVTPEGGTETLAGTIDWGDNTAVPDYSRVLMLSGEPITGIRLKMIAANGLSSSSYNRFRINEVEAYVKK